ncbi:MAG: sulfurtransferase [Methylococcaceae bacterium]|jgi:thiosulfate/3-mercaptopyruvate sulfurtransferase|nr:sulfurtransferase [Methylococcaceae bacterium]MDD1638139.1 sulfurtransferase [Methylococcaceae bacterium]MDD1642479.1 sulfurtransferase [Methylococcaceae bacterium]OYV16874.1 MAG: thiosulfate/3-mercaptopyruvate sulfurtransferase [Methylococcaceae bacterium NSM2-1]
MTFTTLISATTLHQHLNDPNWVVVDCRFSLANSDAGDYAYRHGHIPHARYAHLNRDLSSAITDFTGRHPLPDFTLLAKKLGAWGIANDSQVIVYDDAGGAFAGRLWWLLRCLGHDKVAVLNGGIQQWQKQGFSLTTTLPAIKPATFRPYLNTAYWLNASQVQNCLAKKAVCLIDARTPERYRGEQEPIDPVAGHIPGAQNRAFQSNLDNQGLFLSADSLHNQFKKLIGTSRPEQVVHYCGSGVTACHNLLAMEYAGLTGSKLYAGSWSEWIRNKNRPVAAGSAI